QRFNLPNTAALLVAVDVEREQPLIPHQRLYRLGLRKDHVDRDVVVRADFFDELIRLGVETTGVEDEDLERIAERRGHVDERDILGAAERDGHVRRKFLQRELEDILRIPRRVAAGDRAEGGQIEGHPVTVLRVSESRNIWSVRLRLRLPRTTA